jgi:hypothetical protein
MDNYLVAALGVTLLLTVIALVLTSERVIDKNVKLISANSRIEELEFENKILKEKLEFARMQIASILKK